MVRIGFGMRFVALLIDGVILFIVRWILLIPFGVKITNLNTSDPNAFLNAALHAAARAALIMGIVGIAYTLMEVFLAQTPGKMAVKLKITNPDGSPAPQDKLWRRWAIKNSPLILSFIYGLTGITMLNFLVGLAGIFVIVSCFMTLRDSKLALHDEWAETAVFGPATVTMPSGFPMQPTTTTTAPPAAESANVPPPTAPVG